MNRRLSADPVALILGITSLMIVFLGCCCGVFVVVSLVISIIGLILANKSIRDYEGAPDQYSANSKNNVFIGKVLNIIALVVSAIALLVVVISFAIYGTILSSSVMNDFYKNRNQIEELQDSIRTMDHDSISEFEELYIDTVRVETETE